jgi:hypothetical protein
VNAAAVMAGTARPRQRRAAGGVGTDSGLRLLFGGALRRQLRWSPEPDAPDARALGVGELRLAIHWVELSLHDLSRVARDGPSPARRGAADWHPVHAIGCAEVVESRLPDPLPQRWLLGPLHLGTHQVLRLLSTDAAGCIAAAADDAPALRPLHYTWIPALPQRSAVTGLDAVEQAVTALRDRGDGGERSVRLSLAPAGVAPMPEHPALAP